MRQRVRSKLEVNHLGHGPFSGLAVEWCARAPGGPDALALPAFLGIVDAAVHAFGEEAQRVGHAHDYELAVHQGDQRIRRIAGNDGRVLAQPQRVELIHPDRSNANRRCPIVFTFLNFGPGVG